MNDLDHRIEIVIAGTVTTVTPATSPAVIGRGADCDIVVTDPSVSTRHATLRYDDGRWKLVDSSTYGTFVDGERVGSVEIDGPVTVHLSAPGTGVRLDLRPIAGAPSERGAPTPPEPPAGGSDDLGGQPLPPPAGETRPAIAGQSIRITDGRGVSRVLNPGQELVIGREASAGAGFLSVAAGNDVVSRRHARVAFDGGSWWLTDLDTSRGTFLDGEPVKRQRLAGEMTIWLGSPSTGERIQFETAGTYRRRKPSMLPVIAAVVVALVVAGAALLLARRTPDLNAAGNDVDRMKGATGLVITDDGKGSSTVLCGDHLVLTNAHVAQPDAPGQGLLYSSADPPIDAIYLAYPPADDLDGIVEVRYRAEVVAYDGYVDAAVLRIVGEASGRYPDIVDGPAIPDPSELDLPCADLPENDVLPSKTAVDVYGYPGVTASDDPSRFYDVQLDADSNELTSYTEDVLLDARHGWMNLGRDIQGGNSGGLVAHDNAIVGMPTRAGPNRQGEFSSQARPIGLARRVIEAAREGRTGDLADYLTPLTGDEKFLTTTTDAEGCAVRSLDDNPAETLAFVLSWTGVPDDAHAEVYVSAGDTNLFYEMIGRSGSGAGILADTSCIAFYNGPVDAQLTIGVYAGPNLELQEVEIE